MSNETLGSYHMPFLLRMRIQKKHIRGLFENGAPLYEIEWFRKFRGMLRSGVCGDTRVVTWPILADHSSALATTHMPAVLNNRRLILKSSAWPDVVSLVLSSGAERLGPLPASFGA